MNIISHDFDPDEIFWLYPQAGFQAGDQIIVYDGQEVVIVCNNQTNENFGPGTHLLGSASLCTTFYTLKYSDSHSGKIQAEICFVDKESRDYKWASETEELVFDQTLKDVLKLTANGSISYRISNSGSFLRNLIMESDRNKSTTSVSKVKSGFLSVLKLAKDTFMQEYLLPKWTQERTMQLVNKELNKNMIDVLCAVGKDQKKSLAELISLDRKFLTTLCIAKFPMYMSVMGIEISDFQISEFNILDIAAENRNFVTPAQVNKDSPFYINSVQDTKPAIDTSGYLDANGEFIKLNAIKHEFSKDEFLWKNPNSLLESDDQVLVAADQAVVSVYNDTLTDQISQGTHSMNFNNFIMLYQSQHLSDTHIGPLAADLWFINTAIHDSELPAAMPLLMTDKKYEYDICAMLSGSYSFRICSPYSFMNLYGLDLIKEIQSSQSKSAKSSIFGLLSEKSNSKPDETVLSAQINEKIANLIQEEVVKTIQKTLTDKLSKEKNSIVELSCMSPEKLAAFSLELLGLMPDIMGLELSNLNLRSIKTVETLDDLRKNQIDNPLGKKTEISVTTINPKQAVTGDSIIDPATIAGAIWHKPMSGELMWKWPVSSFDLGDLFIVNPDQSLIVVDSKETMDTFSARSDRFSHSNLMTLFMKRGYPDDYQGPIKAELWFASRLPIDNIQFSQIDMLVHEPIYQYISKVSAMGTFSFRIAQPWYFYLHHPYSDWAKDKIIAKVKECFIQVLQLALEKLSNESNTSVVELLDDDTEALSASLLPHMNGAVQLTGAEITQLEFTSLSTYDTVETLHSAGFREGKEIKHNPVRIKQDDQLHHQVVRNEPTASPPPPPVVTLYHALINDKQIGPIDLATIGDLILQQKLHKDSYVWKPGMSVWDKASTLNDLAPYFQQLPPPPPPIT